MYLRKAETVCTMKKAMRRLPLHYAIHTVAANAEPLPVTEINI